MCTFYIYMKISLHYIKTINNDICTTGKLWCAENFKKNYCNCGATQTPKKANYPVF